jgi:hypothetical protein
MGILLVLLAATLAGCTGPDQGPSQNLRTPLLIVDWTPDNNTTLYVHSAFTSEQVYDGIALSFDNETVAQANQTYALSHKSNRTDFFLGVHVADGDDRFRYEAQVDVNATGGLLGVADWNQEETRLEGRTNATLPFKKVIPSYDPQTVEP